MEEGQLRHRFQSWRGVSPVSLSCVFHLSPQTLGAGSRGQPSPLLPGDLRLHRGGGETAGSCTDAQPREAACAHPGNVASVPLYAGASCVASCCWQPFTFHYVLGRTRLGLWLCLVAALSAPFRLLPGIRQHLHVTLWLLLRKMSYHCTLTVEVSSLRSKSGPSKTFCSIIRHMTTLMSW